MALTYIVGVIVTLLFFDKSLGLPLDTVSIVWSMLWPIFWPLAIINIITK